MRSVANKAHEKLKARDKMTNEKNYPASAEPWTQPNTRATRQANHMVPRRQKTHAV